ncbi:glycoside hydrolase family 15 protein [Edaphobacter bradus]|uniref:glycoside hydrolase family 15 protein n=1 Tax=Edaphobacter bradus TaxID=2259016 RepID=UPI0021E0A1E4|nr:glycoside hydrolase family 15 protein [Edaphobacter bradus]
MPAAASHLVTGNGFGFAVVSPENATVSKFYAHPYSFVRPDPKNPLSEGVEAANFIKALGWSGGVTRGASAEYENDSHVIDARSSEGRGLVFMPFGLREAALIVSWEPGSDRAKQGGLYVEWSRPVRSQRTVRMFGAEMQWLKFDDIAESLLLIPLGPKQIKPARGEQFPSGSLAWALISVESDDELAQAANDFNTWQAGLAPQALAKREIAELERWRARPAIHFDGEEERHLWRQSEVMLRIAQSREPNRPGRNSNGLIVASLPDGVWFTPWVRDMAYAAVALARMGHRDEARAALLAYFNAQPTGKMRDETRGADYQISVVRYFGDGSEEPFFTQEGSTNIEFDDWGEVLWVLGEYLRKYEEPDLLSTPTYRGRMYESAKDYVVKPLLANLEKYDEGLIVAADTSIWEERQKDKKHFAFSTAMAIVGLREFAAVAQRAGDEATRAEVLRQAALLEKGFSAAFVRDGKLRGTLEEGVKNDIDGALLAIINFRVVTDPAVVRDAVERVELLKVASGGYRRVRSTYTDPAIFEYWYERQEFLFVDLSMAEVYRRLGRDPEAAAILKRIVDKAAADHNVVPEMYVAVPCRLFPGALGDPTGALPMVGYGAGAYILHVLDWKRLETNH